jgi:hypothetical protein
MERMMFIKVTNAAPGRQGDPLLLNLNNIVSIFEDHLDGGSLRTVIYVQQDMSYFVEESVEKIHTLIKAAQS